MHLKLEQHSFNEIDICRQLVSVVNMCLYKVDYQNPCGLYNYASTFRGQYILIVVND